MPVAAVNRSFWNWNVPLLAEKSSSASAGSVRKPSGRYAVLTSRDATPKRFTSSK